MTLHCSQTPWRDSPKFLGFLAFLAECFTDLLLSTCRIFMQLSQTREALQDLVDPTIQMLSEVFLIKVCICYQTVCFCCCCPFCSDPISQYKLNTLGATCRACCKVIEHVVYGLAHKLGDSSTGSGTMNNRLETRGQRSVSSAKLYP